MWMYVDICATCFMRSAKQETGANNREPHADGCQVTEMSKQLGMHYNMVKKYVSKLEEFDIVSSRQTYIYFMNEEKLREILPSPAL
jgi:hypothetical protein